MFFTIVVDCIVNALKKSSVSLIFIAYFAICIFRWNPQCRNGQNNANSENWSFRRSIFVDNV